MDENYKFEANVTLIFCHENAKKNSQDSRCESISGNEVPFQAEKYFGNARVYYFAGNDSRLNQLFRASMS